MEEKNVFTGKTVDEALDLGMKELGLTLADEYSYEVLEEGKKGFLGLGTVNAKIRITVKQDESKRAVEFIDGLLAIMGVKGVSEIDPAAENLTINIRTENSARVIGKRGDVLDAIQCMAGAVANIGKDEYKKVVVDCENYREHREQTLKELAKKLASKAVESGRKMILEPMSPYERRIIHAALVDNTDVKTISEGREPARYIVVIPNNAKPYDRGVRYGERNRDDRRGGRDNRDRRERRGGREGGRDNRDGRGRGERSARPAGGAKRGKKEIYFGTFLGNSNADKNDEGNKE